ncbi:MAG TPA: hypothetical protein VN840_15870 [Streptosporangiaceae bacterium]|nr:hypothetical protein [Streptosporangiaceae bacterium]
MSSTHMVGTGTADSSRQWDALDSRNERLVEASHPLLRAPDQGSNDGDQHAATAA